MATPDWLGLLGWDNDQLNDIRFVGFSYIQQGKYAIATKFFEALTTLKDDEAYDLQTLGALYLETGNNLSALNYLEKALKIEPDHDPTLLNKVKALFQLGYKKQALEQVRLLQQSANKAVSAQAQALKLSYS